MTVSHSVLCRARSGTHDQILVSLDVHVLYHRQVPSMTTGRVCHRSLCQSFKVFTNVHMNNSTSWLPGNVYTAKKCKEKSEILTL
jgi:hypothetical protein